MRKVFLEDLPRRKGKTNQVDWKKSLKYKVKFVYDDIEGEVEIIDYNSSTNKLFIKYTDKELFKIVTKSFQECKLGKLLGKITNEFKAEIGQTFKDDKRDLIITNREYKSSLKEDVLTQKFKYYKYKCNKCGYDEGWIMESNLLKGIGCSCCSPFIKKVVEGINDIPTTAPWMIKYFQGGYNEAKLYTKTSGQSIYPICPDCGRIRKSPIVIAKIHDRKSISCTCGDGQSYPNKFMFNVLEQLNIDFTSEYSPDWIGLMRYDFYFELENNKYIVEMDGGWHNQYNNRSKQTAKESKEIDIYKDNIANKHNIEVIRIDSVMSELEYIKNNILNSKLNIIFDLTKMNWNMVEEFALSNRVRKACEHKKNNPDMTTREIGEIMKISYVTVVDYLKKGTNLGWCNYNTKEEKEKKL